MKKIYLPILLLSLFSCTTTLDFNIPSNRFQTAEVAGKTLGGRAEVSLGRGNEFELAQIYDAGLFNSTADVTTDQSVEDTLAIGINLSLGIIERLDAYYFSYYDAADIFGLKYQFLGDVGNDKEGHKMALMLGGGKSGEDEYAQIKRNDPTREYQGRLDLAAYEASLLYSYRFTKNFSTYFNFTHSIYKSTATLKSDTTDLLKIRGYARTNIVLMGLDLSTGYNNAFGVMVEVGYVKGEWQNTYENEDIPLGASLYFKW